MARMPIQRTSWAGSVNIAYTASAQARTAISLTTASSSIAFDLVAHAREPLAPERLERAADLGDPLAIGLVIAVVAGAADTDEAGLAQHAQVLGGRGLAERAEGGDLACRPLA